MMSTATLTTGWCGRHNLRTVLEFAGLESSQINAATTKPSRAKVGCEVCRDTATTVVRVAFPTGR